MRVAPSKIEMSPTRPVASVPITPLVAVARAAFAVTISQSCSSEKNPSSPMELKLSAQRSSRSRFIEPEGSQSVPSAMETPMRATSVTRAVSP